MAITSEDIDKNLGTVFSDIMDENGITQEFLAEKLKAELKAKSTKTFLDRDRGKVVYSKSMIAWDVRQRARRDGLAYHGYFPERFSNGEGSNINLVGQQNNVFLIPATLSEKEWEKKAKLVLKGALPRAELPKPRMLKKSSL
jgi:hypothetical protein